MQKSKAPRAAHPRGRKKGADALNLPKIHEIVNCLKALLAALAVHLWRSGVRP